MCLESARLVLRPWAEIDGLEFRPIAQDPRVMRYINDGQPWTDSVIQEFVNRQIEACSVRKYCRWKLILKDTGEMAGFCGAGMLDGLADPEIGWWLAHKYWGQGLAIEAARVALDDLFTRIALQRVISVAIPDNLRSIRIMEKLGLSHQADGIRKGFPVVIYGISRSEYMHGRTSR
jgi:RimJ/RimL family protein N-acetyltransferase